MNDGKTTVEQLKKQVLAFRQRRKWTGEDPKDIALSVVLEATELLEHFQWKTGEEVRQEARLYGPICDELADVLWWALVMAESLHIDLAHAFEMKMEKNEEKYPEKIFASDVSEAERWRHYYRIKAKYRGGHPLAEGESEE